MLIILNNIIIRKMLIMHIWSDYKQCTDILKQNVQNILIHSGDRNHKTPRLDLVPFSVKNLNIHTHNHINWHLWKITLQCIKFFFLEIKTYSGMQKFGNPLQNLWKCESF